MEARALKIHPDDDVAVLLSPAIAAGTHVRIGTHDYYTDQAIPSGHKIALRALAAGEVVRKFGQPFARTTQAIAPGHWLHTHNAKTMLGANESYEYVPYSPPPSPRPAGGKVFDGFLRADGKVGIRN